MRYKYLNKTYNGYWKVVKCIPMDKNGNHYKYVLENQYNKKTIEVIDSVLRKIDKGETKLEYIIARRVKIHKRKLGIDCWGNLYETD